MKEDLKTILFVGLGAISETSEKAKEISDNLYNKGKELYEKGVIANEELKHKINDVVKENVTVVNVNVNNSMEDILNSIDALNLEEKKELLKALNKKGWADVEYENGEGSQES